MSFPERTLSLGISERRELKAREYRRIFHKTKLRQILARKMEFKRLVKILRQLIKRLALCYHRKIKALCNVLMIPFKNMYLDYLFHNMPIINASRPCVKLNLMIF